jgi:N-acetylmuramoyl-L-alanine amidase
MEILERPSPNHDARSDGASVDILLLHYTGMEGAEVALARLCDPAAKVSAHYCIEEDGRVSRLVPEDRRAWHAGVSCWAGAENVNARSIGIELVNPGHEFGYRAFPEAQMTVLMALARDILTRHPIPPRRVLGHSDVAPLRKEDPGELFDWARLARAGIGLWPQDLASPAGPAADPAAEAEVRAGLARFGYGYLEDDFAAVVTAFQRHFRPGAVTGEADGGTAAVLRALLELVD